MIYVTHDQIEAMTLADRIVVFDAGVIQQEGAPLDLYRNPSNLFVATFIGSPKMNILSCSANTDGIVVADGTVIKMPEIQGDAKHFGIRPEHVKVVPLDQAILRGTVGVAEHLGGDSFIYVDIDGVEEPMNVRIAGGACSALTKRV